jgi:putative endonuclease
VYLLRCADDSLYCGITTDLERRVAEHGEGRGARYTRPRRPVELVWWEEAPDRSAAASREHAVKALDKGSKEALVEREGDREP